MDTWEMLGYLRDTWVIMGHNETLVEVFIRYMGICEVYKYMRDTCTRVNYMDTWDSLDPSKLFLACD